MPWLDVPPPSSARSGATPSASPASSTPTPTSPRWSSAPTPALGPTCARGCSRRSADLRPSTAEKLTETLRSWLLHQGRRDAVAAELFVHPQTVRYRVGQLRELYGDRLEDPPSCWTPWSPWPDRPVGAKALPQSAETPSPSRRKRPAESAQTRRSGRQPGAVRADSAPVLPTRRAVSARLGVRFCRLGGARRPAPPRPRSRGPARRSHAAEPRGRRRPRRRAGRRRAARGRRGAPRPRCPSRRWTRPAPRAG